MPFLPIPLSIPLSAIPFPTARPDRRPVPPPDAWRIADSIVVAAW